MAKAKTPKQTPEKLEAMRHSLSHVLAMAVLDMFPEAKLGIGPAIADGFYYDFELPRTLIPEDLPLLEKKMRHFIKQGLRFEGEKVPPKQAVDTLKQANQPYKVELAEEFARNKEPITFYRTGKFVDLCKGGHVKSTKEIGAFALTKIAGAYWRGDEKNPQLQRIYGVAFATQQELQGYLAKQEQAKDRDHRKLGRELGLFVTNEDVGAGLPIFTPKGAFIYQALVEYLAGLQKDEGYQPVISPHIARKKLFEVSGHWQNYRDSMYSPINVDGEEFLLKAMNCPFHIQVYAAETRSYRDLPIRLAEFGTVYRYEKSGEIGGLTRVRGFTIDDAHIFVRPDQVLEEFVAVLKFTAKALKVLGLTDYQIRFGTKDPKSRKYIGEDKLWKKAQDDITKALKQAKVQYFEGPGDAAFYGPKLDFVVKDVLGREWQLGTVQLDYALPERFDLTYTGEDGKNHRPVMIHRAPFGSLERFFGILIEHLGGAWPLWLAPEQVRILPIADRHLGAANKVAKALTEAGLRAVVDDRTESVGKKIRAAEVEKIPYMFVIGDKEKKSDTVAVRSYHKGDLGSQKVPAISKTLVAESTKKQLPKTS